MDFKVKGFERGVIGDTEWAARLGALEETPPARNLGLTPQINISYTIETDSPTLIHFTTSATVPRSKVMNLLEYHHFAQGGVLPENVTMTLEEFLESGLEGYEYVQGELVQMPATSVSQLYLLLEKM